MGAPRPGEVDNGIATTRVPISTAGLSVASKCQSAVVGNRSGLSNDRDGHAGEGNQCQPTEESIEPENTTPTRIRVDSSNYSSMSTTTSLSADAAATMILSCPDGFQIRGDTCFPTEEPAQAIVARNSDGGDTWIHPRINNAHERGPDAVERQLFPRQSASESITTTITPIIIQAPTTTSTPVSSSFASPVTQIITTATPTPTSSPALSTLTSIPLLIATGSYSTIYSIPSITPTAPTPSASSNSNSSGLSVGAKAGIAIGVTLVVIAIGVLLAMLHIRRRRKLQNHDSNPSRAKTKGKQQAPPATRTPRTDPGTLEKGTPSAQHPTMGMQAALPPGFTIPYTASRSPAGAHPGTKIEIDNSDRHAPEDTGPHELDVGEKFEMDAGYTGHERESTIDSFPLGFSPIASRAVSPTIASRAVTPTIASRAVTPSIPSRAVTPSLRDRSGSVGHNTPHRAETGSRGVTPKSSFSRDVHSRGGDARTGYGMGHISPMSQRIERSFLDLD